ncbi:orotidine-5'-phosphate decarboxylase [Helcobacillus massiliensis]|uniref:Orotidine-5'-phosphate decarboxylase n=1 Tax=Helcobacillus massiliensis TaxID=521392 RepID=A0A839QTZ8_9MICO|nr:MULTISPECIES: orotidine-5'-phosphate decarboxylase [Helcobacillus]MBB3022329.1 orotidine-5'-phosphate decarboxylase [Helcobacillus massiliensis]MCG7426451.1 orotidine-5'-phosphate decarboxylase [Helcobacillus sp. ACRRO]MCT1556968.1 orotidine-5'-phosphate decarboxylase [Helcobacillus massiliensis]MCT2035357.1 orotidine-5'-phosphate decarboxylase [Helcobacillus massiliensis]MCT2331428.1 orotidine-5'-phosphate decarboxylase [Helcobacillus massiliensis]
MSFGTDLQASVAERGPIVAGIDPHASVLEQWGLPNTAAGARDLSLRMLEAVQGRVSAIKPQAAFFERFGADGFAVLEELLQAARAAGVLTILDAKRGDIGSTMGAYAEAFLAPGAPMEVDALTVSPYLGYGSLEPAAERVCSAGKGMFVLSLTSNPDGPEVQHARTADGVPVASVMARHAAEANAQARAAGEWGSVGLVVGATIGSAAADLGIDLDAVGGPLLAPGFGAQGAGPAQLRSVFGSAAPRVLVSMSRSLMAAGPDAGAISAACESTRADYAL